MPSRSRTPVIALTVVVALLLALVGYLLLRETGGDETPAADAPAAADQADQAGQESGERERTPEEVPGREAMEGIARFEEDDPLALGPVDAPVVMTVHSDYRCPFCAKFSREIEPELIEEYVEPGHLRIEWRDLPIFGEESMLAARAGRAAADQDRFWEFNRALYAASPDRGHPDLDEDTLVGFAREAGVADLERFRADMTSDRYDAVIGEDHQMALALGATSTPTFLVNGTGVIGARPVETFRTVIDRELAG
ncbi:MAG TPA: thioredoxin domain-containing protein [Actinomycetales bacterium]|nr:thioredoxin domain-containing protein [Actinomycetales bacterium]